MFAMRPYIASLICMLALGLTSRAQPPVSGTTTERTTLATEQLQGAVERGYQILLKGAKNYPEHRDCFSCHHQTLPLMALAIEHRSGEHRSGENGMEGEGYGPAPANAAQEKEQVDAPNLRFSERPATKAILDFMQTSFASKQDSMREGTGVGGGALTVAYGLWGMDLAEAERSETTDAMVEYLLKTQAEDGGWRFQSLRPPAASSRAMTTAIAIYGLRAYGPTAVAPDRLQQAYQRAQAWGATVQEQLSHEDLTGLIWLDYMLAKEEVAPKSQELQRARIAQLFSSQNEDGGWGQLEDMPSDAYATGQSLLMLAQLASVKGEYMLLPEARLRKALKYLLESQEADGSWHVVTRAKPVQVYFDNGDPHGKDQFISMMATAWATAALANQHFAAVNPLESLQAIARVSQEERP